MGRYVVHVGYGKTGTTYLQAFLRKNREHLRGYGVLYPDVRMGGVWLQVGNHNLFGQALADRPGWHGIGAHQYIGQFEQQRTADSRIGTVVISGETILGIPQPWETVDHDHYWALHRAKVARLADLLSEHDVKIVVYLRSQEQWLESTAAQTVKYEGMSPTRIFRTPEDYIRIMEPRLDYARVLDLWAEHFGSSGIEVAWYSRETLAGQDIARDFLNRLGVGSVVGAALPGENTSASNPTWRADVVRFKQGRNMFLRTKSEERILAESLAEIDAELKASDSVAPIMIPESLKEKVQRRYAESNRAVARRFSGGADVGHVVPGERRPRNRAAARFDLPVERAIEIEYRLRQNLDARNGRSRSRRHRIGQWLRQKSPVIYVWIHTLWTVIGRRIRSWY